MASVQDIFDSLMKDPNHYFQGVEAVEQEAVRRVRQHDNNEKALSMAIQNSAVDRLSTFLRKEFTSLDSSILANMQSIQGFYKTLQDAMEVYENSEESENRGQPDGWMEFLADDGSIPETDKFDDGSNIWDKASDYLKDRDLLHRVITGLSREQDRGLKDIFPSQADQRNLTRLTGEGGLIDPRTGNIREEVGNKFADWLAHPSVQLNAQRIVDSGRQLQGNGGILGQGGDGDPDPTPDPTDRGRRYDTSPEPWTREGREGDPERHPTLAELNDLNFNEHMDGRTQTGSKSTGFGWLWESPEDTAGLRPYLGRDIQNEWNDAGWIRFPTDQPQGAETWEWTQNALDHHLPSILDALHSYTVNVPGNPRPYQAKVIRSRILRELVSYFNYTNPDTGEVENQLTEPWSSAQVQAENARWAPVREAVAQAFNNDGNFGDRNWKNTFRINTGEGGGGTGESSDFSLEELNNSWDDKWGILRQKLPKLSKTDDAEFQHHISPAYADIDPEYNYFSVKDPLPGEGQDEDVHPLSIIKDKKIEGQELRDMITRLRGIYLKMHQPRYEADGSDAGEELLADHPTFRGSFPYFGRDDLWTDAHKENFNKLMFNKALTEQYLEALVGLAKGQHSVSWDRDVWPSVTNEEDYPWLEGTETFWVDPKTGDPLVASGRGQIDVPHLFPQNGNYSWLELFLGHNTPDSYFRDREGAINPAFDERGFPNFAAVHGRHYRNNRYGFENDWTHENHFSGTFGLMVNGEYTPHWNSEQHLKEHIKQQEPDGIKFFQDEHGQYTESKWITALNAYKRQNNLDENASVNYVGEFGPWLTNTVDGQPNWKNYLASQQGLGGGGGPQPSGDGRSPTGQQGRLIPFTSEEEADRKYRETETARLLAEMQQRRETAERAQQRDPKIKEIMQRIGYDPSTSHHKRHIDFLNGLDDKAFENEYHEKVIRADEKAMQTQRDNAIKEREKQQKLEEGGEKAEPLKRDDTITAMEQMLSDMNPDGHSPDARHIQSFKYMDEKQLRSAYTSLTAKHHEYMTNKAKQDKIEESKEMLHKFPSLADQLDTLTEEQLVTHMRSLVGWKSKYGSLVDPKADARYHELMRADYRYAKAAGIDIDEIMGEDMEDALNHGNDLGTPDWRHRREGQSEEDSDMQQAHRASVSGGAELRRNPNYKPHIIAQYTNNGDFLAYHNLQTGEPLDPAELRFDEDNHHIFHGLDPQKVHNYLRYRNRIREQGSEIVTRQAQKDELADLERTVHAPDYDQARTRIDEALDHHGGALPTARDAFHGKFGSANRPIRPDGKEEFPPIFYRDEYNDPKAGWYHRESESWVNPHRYNDLINSMRGPDGQVKQGSGRFVAAGRHYYGKDVRGQSNPRNSIYSFAVPTHAKQQRLKNGTSHEDQSYYIDHTGGIAHVENDFTTRNKALRGNSLPHTHNDVIHDWYSQQIMNQFRDNPAVFKNERNQLRDVAVIDTPSDYKPLQNMLLQKDLNPWSRYNTGLGRAKDSALSRREVREKVGPEWWRNFKNTPIGERYGPWAEDQLTHMQQGSTTLRHPRSQAAKDPLTSQELGQNALLNPKREAVETMFDWMENVPWASGIAKFMLGQNSVEHRINRRQRKQYQIQADVERQLRDVVNKIKISNPDHPRAETLGKYYVSPGEQQARNEDYKTLKDHFGYLASHHSNSRKMAIDQEDPDMAEVHNKKFLHYRDLAIELGQLDPTRTAHWSDYTHSDTGKTRKGINSMFEEHLGGVKSAPSPNQSLGDFGMRMGQESQEESEPDLIGSHFNFENEGPIPSHFTKPPPTVPSHTPTIPPVENPMNTPWKNTGQNV